MLIGYARVSTQDQNPEMQLDELTAAGCERIWTDHVTGTRADRPQLTQARSHAREGDTLVVWRLDRLARSLRDLLTIAAELDGAGVGLRSLRESIDTTTPTGRLVFHIFGALAEFERDLIRERTTTGLQAARARGRLGGRKPVLTADQVNAARQLYDAKKHTVQQIADMFGVSRTTIYRAIERQEQP